MLFRSLVDAAGERAGRLSSALRLEDGRWIGLALVRRGWLNASWLGLKGTAAQLWMSTPPQLVPPPQGAGGQGAA